MPSLIVGYHGCDRSLVENVVAGRDELKLSQNAWDWLGHGIYQAVSLASTSQLLHRVDAAAVSESAFIQTVEVALPNDRRRLVCWAGAFVAGEPVEEPGA